MLTDYSVLTRVGVLIPAIMEPALSPMARMISVMLARSSVFTSSP